MICVCDKWFICTATDKKIAKCSTREALEKKIQYDKIRSCFKYNWVDQSEHVREYNWSQIGMPF